MLRHAAIYVTPLFAAFRCRQLLLLISRLSPPSMLSFFVSMPLRARQSDAPYARGDARREVCCLLAALIARNWPLMPLPCRRHGALCCCCRHCLLFAIALRQIQNTPSPLLHVYTALSQSYSCHAATPLLSLFFAMPLLFAPDAFSLDGFAAPPLPPSAFSMLHFRCAVVAIRSPRQITLMLIRALRLMLLPCRLFIFSSSAYFALMP